jgi:hypothetical protein
MKLAMSYPKAPPELKGTKNGERRSKKGMGVDKDRAPIKSRKLLSGILLAGKGRYARRLNGGRDQQMGQADRNGAEP